MSVEFGFRLFETDNCARRGEVLTSRGTIHTPAFMPVGTQATVKAMYPGHVRSSGTDILLGNSYHLMLRPGAERVARLGGLHQFMNWPYPILTDSGGFQIMSLSTLCKITEDGVLFRSHIDGAQHMLTVEKAVNIQFLLGADIQMQLDECVAFPCHQDKLTQAMHRSLRWAERAQIAFGNKPTQALFAIVQGGISEEIRIESAHSLRSMDFKGYAIGGLAVGESQKDMLRILDVTIPLLPKNKPRYLMGVGTPEDILFAVARGIDMFDCVLPTRAGRHGHAYTRLGRLNLRNACHAEDSRPLDPESDCPAANGYSRAYLHHLFKAEEMLGAMILTWANIAYYQKLMSDIRLAIKEKRFTAFTEMTHYDWKMEKKKPSGKN
ncbi:MAG: tRNA guanosine(34) transglycosylase Tgt [Alphaproteobacteria bacterium]|nr:tRNA guanosine(34) transglycosylase Tgt [Alphaproteobacteria bacterium]